MLAALLLNIATGTVDPGGAWRRRNRKQRRAITQKVFTDKQLQDELRVAYRKLVGTNVEPAVVAALKPFSHSTTTPAEIEIDWHYVIQELAIVRLLLTMYYDILDEDLILILERSESV